MAAGFVHTRRKRLSFPRFAGDLMCPWVSRSRGCRVVVMLRAGSGWLEVRIRSGCACPAVSDGRAGFAATDPGVPGAGAGARRPRCDRPRVFPRVFPRARPADPSRPGPAGRHAGRRAGAPLTISQGHHDGRAAPVGAVRHRENPGRPIRVTVPGRAGHAPRPGCSLQPPSLAERGKLQLPGSWLATRFPPRAFRDRLVASAAPGHGGAAQAQPRRSRWRGAL